MGILVDVTNQPNSRKLCQDLVFFVGPLKGKTLESEADFETRMEDVEQLFKSGLSGISPIQSVLETGLASATKKIVAERTSGGIRGTLCPNIRIDAVVSEVITGRALVMLINKDGVLQMCKILQATLNAEWIDAWYYGQFSNVPKFRVQYPATAP